MTCNLEEFTAACREITRSIEALRLRHTTVVYGVIDPRSYYSAHPRIMWLLKEANSDDDWSYPEKFRDGEWLAKYNGLATIRRIIYTSYGILYGRGRQWNEYPWSYETESLAALREIAIVNIKKEPGGSTAVDGQIYDAYRANRSILKRQVEVYDPDIIIFGNTMSYVEREDFPGLTEAGKRVSPFHNHYYEGGGKLYINAWHPACRGAGFTDFNYVMDIVRICHGRKG